MSNIHNWTPEQRRELVALVDVKTAELRDDPDLDAHITTIIALAALPNSTDVRKAIVLGAVLHSIGNDDV